MLSFLCQSYKNETNNFTLKLNLLKTRKINYFFVIYYFDNKTRLQNIYLTEKASKNHGKQ